MSADERARPLMPADPIATVPTDELRRWTDRAYWRAARSWGEACSAGSGSRALLVDAARSDATHYARLRAALDQRDGRR